MNFNRMLIKLYIIPVLFFIGTFVFLYILNTTIPSYFEHSGTLSGIGKQAQRIAPEVFLCMFGLATLWWFYCSFNLWLWFSGRDNKSCYNCGGMTEYHPKGRYGPYYKCMACGKNRADR